MLGCTGSVGTQALRFLDRPPAAFEVVGLGEGGSRQVEPADQVARFPDAVFAFTSGSMPFPGIIDVWSAILDEAGGMSEEPGGVQQVLDTEVWASARADEIIANTVGVAHSMGSAAMWVAQ